MNKGTIVTISLIIIVIVVGVMMGIGDDIVPQQSQVEQNPQTIPEQGDYVPMKEAVERALEDAKEQINP